MGSGDARSGNIKKYVVKIASFCMMKEVFQSTGEPQAMD